MSAGGGEKHGIRADRSQETPLPRTGKWAAAEVHCGNWPRGAEMLNRGDGGGGCAVKVLEWTNWTAASIQVYQQLQTAGAKHWRPFTHVVYIIMYSVVMDHRGIKSMYSYNKGEQLDYLSICNYCPLKCFIFNSMTQCCPTLSCHCFIFSHSLYHICNAYVGLCQLVFVLLLPSIVPWTFDYLALCYQEHRSPEFFCFFRSKMSEQPQSSNLESILYMTLSISYLVWGFFVIKGLICDIELIKLKEKQTLRCTELAVLWHLE